MDGAVDLNLSDGEKPQKQIQALIRAEIARHHPIQGAFRPLEIIAESSVRVVDNGDSARYEIIDEDGVVRAGPNMGARSRSRTWPRSCATSIPRFLR